MPSKTCIVTRLLDPFRVAEELRVVLGKASRLKLSMDYAIIDDSDTDFLAAVNVFMNCRWLLELDKDISWLLRTTRLFLRFSELNGMVKDTERMLKEAGDSSLREKYLRLVDERDKLLPELSMIWEDEPVFFDKLMDCVNKLSKDIAGLADEIPLKYDEFKPVLEEIRSRLSKLARGPRLLWLFDFVWAGRSRPSELGLADKVSILRRGLNDKCDGLVIVDGEEYGIIVELKGLNDVSVV